MAPAFDRLAGGNGLELRLGRELKEMQVRLAKRPVFVGLRCERVEPPFYVALLDRLLEALANIGLRMRDGVDLVELTWVRVAVGQRRGVLERCLG